MNVGRPVVSPRLSKAGEQRYERLLAPAWVDLTAVATCTVLFMLFLNTYAFHDTLAEYDLYSVATGLWDGHVAGTGIDSPNHYGKWFSFGYIYLCYLIGSAADFADRDAIFRLINVIGYWATVACFPAVWLALRVGYGRAVAWVASPLFLLSPVFLEVAGGGHSVLPATACFFLGAALLWCSGRLLLVMMCRIGATLLLTAALTLRFEVAFAYPLLVLATAPQAWRECLRSWCWRLLPTIGSLVLFFVLRSLILGATGNESAEFVSVWYDWHNFAKGGVGLILAVGIASSFAALWALVHVAGVNQGGIAPRQTWLSLAIPLLGPLIAVVVAAAFWLPNPFPARHFLFLTVGVALTIAICATRVGLSAARLAILVLVLVIANQAISAALAPALLKVSGYDKIRPWPYLLTVPSGDAWDRRQFFKQTWARVIHTGDDLALNACEDKVVMFSYWRPMIAASFLRPGWAPQFSYSAFPRDFSSPLYTVITQGSRTIVLMARNSPGSSNPVGPVLADPQYAGYKFLVDPDSVEVTDHDVVPPDRQAHLTCSRE